MTCPSMPHIPVSWGELIDKLTILDIKLASIARPDARANVARERDELARIAAPVLDRVASEVAALRVINMALWDIEDAIREEEAASRFGDQFVALARSVYRRNDDRAQVKRRINDLLGSELVEEKSYANFAATTPAAARFTLAEK